MVYAVKAGIVRDNKAIVHKLKKREASRGGGRIPDKTICGKQVCLPHEYKAVCGLLDGKR